MSVLQIAELINKTYVVMVEYIFFQDLWYSLGVDFCGIPPVYCMWLLILYKIITEETYMNF